jgi:prepilin-type N-terminal cleavage/methylation domain-containing protein
MRRAESRRLAFTLLEVLAAVAILALVYTVLARVGIQGFRAEGGADRRLRASLLADDTLAEIEGQVAMGSPPPIGEKEVRHDEFVIRLRVSPSEIELPPRSDTATQRMAAAAAAKRTGGTAAQASRSKATGAQPTQSFFLPAGPSEPPPGRRIEIRVSWTDGATESAVVRETYGLDQTAAQPLLLALEQTAQAEQAEANGAAPGAPAAAGQAPGQTGQPAPQAVGGEQGIQPPPSAPANPGAM